jgi:hypothetical protein
MPTTKYLEQYNDTTGRTESIKGTAVGQVATWTGSEWVPGPGVGGSGGGGLLWYLNESTAAESPTTNIPSSTNPSTVPGGTTTVKQLGPTPDTPLFTLTSGTLSQVSYDIIAGFVTDVDVPGLTSIPAGLWEFNIWAAASGNIANQTLFRIGVYKYDGTNAPTLIANSDDVYVYDPSTPAQYICSVVIPAGTTLAATDRIYIQMEGKATTNNRTVTFYFGDAKPSHVHTTIILPIDLATQVTGILPVANGGTGAATAAINTVFAGPASGSTGAPTFRALVAADIAGITPYDLRGKFLGTPGSSVVLDSFAADRAFTIGGTNTLHKFWAEEKTAGADVVITVQRTRAGVTNAIFTATSDSADTALNGYYPMTISAVSNNSIEVDDLIEVVMQAGAVDAAFSTPIWTIYGTA